MNDHGYIPVTVHVQKQMVGPVWPRGHSPAQAQPVEGTMLIYFSQVACHYG